MADIERGTISIVYLSIALVMISSFAVAGQLERAKLPGRQVRIAGISVGVGERDCNYEERMSFVLEHLEAAGKAGADIVCLSELFAGWTPETVPGPTTNAVAEPAKQYNMYVICPIREKVGEKEYNTAVLIDRKGKVAGWYRKIFIAPGEEAIPSQEGVKVFDTDFGKICILTCFDSNFAELWQQADLLGAELVFWISGSSANGIWLNAYAVIHSYNIVSVGGGLMVDVAGNEIDIEKPLPRVRVGNIDLDRVFVHQVGTVEKITKMVEEHKGEVTIERRYLHEGWYLLRAIKPGVRVRDLCKEYEIETMRQYRDRCRIEIDEAREERKPI
jgi:hypothetical protein